MFLHVKGKMGELIIGMVEGVWKTRTIQRSPLEDRWRFVNAVLVRERSYSEEDRDHEGRQWVAQRMDGQEELKEKNVVCDDARESVSRNFAIKRGYLEHHGYSAGCPGCKALIRGTARQGHSEACRRRLEGLLSEHKRVEPGKESASTSQSGSRSRSRAARR